MNFFKGILGNMGKLIALAVVLIASGLVYLFNKNYYFPNTIPPQQDGYFGVGTKRADDTKIIPFTINVSLSIINDLNGRLDAVRFYEPLEGVNFEYGFNTEYLKTVQKHWRTVYDWKKAETQLNKYSHFKTEIEGLKVHFLDVKPPAGQKYKKIIPLLLVHGWPGSVYEFYKIMPMLTDPKETLGLSDNVAFHVIAPSIPGYGWSDAPKKKGFSNIAAARVFHKLMQRLKFDRYFCQGGDWGSLITTVVTQSYPDEVIGLHLNMAAPPFSNPALAIQLLIGMVFPSLVVHPTDYHKLYPFGSMVMNTVGEAGYMLIQATKPDTVGFALHDSPMGLAAYILEKFSSWTNMQYRSLSDGGLTRHFTMDELLTNVMIYWTTGSIATSQRLYKEHFADPLQSTYEGAPVHVPTGIAAFPNEIVPCSPRNFLAYKFRNITSYTDMPRGGHFAAFEEPKLLAEDVFRFAATVL